MEKKINIVKMILDIFTPIDNEIQEQIKEYLEEYEDIVNDDIYTSNRFQPRATIINALIKELKMDVCYDIFKKIC